MALLRLASVSGRSVQSLAGARHRLLQSRASVFPASCPAAWRNRAFFVPSLHHSTSSKHAPESSPAQVVAGDDQRSHTRAPGSRSSQPRSLIQLLAIYSELSKARLASLVTLTTMVGYAFAPTATDLPTLVATTLGTALCISSANTFNQVMESPYDAQMSRTRNRPMVRRAITPRHALSFATVTGLAGVASLYSCVNPLTAALGGANLILYAFVYTPLKRISIVNTWVGAVVGAIPPMMGWTACTNSLLTTNDLGAWVLGFFLYAWQFPHFNSLSWNIRSDYAKAGYQMMAVTDPALNARVSLRYALAMLPVPVLTSYAGLTTWWFVGSASLVNGAMAVCAWRFWRHRNDKTARDLFFSSLLHLPVICLAILLHKTSEDNSSKTSVWDRLKYYALGHEIGSKTPSIPSSK